VREAFMAWFRVLFWNFLVGDEELHKNTSRKEVPAIYLTGYF
jgi:hypothetical protein